MLQPTDIHKELESDVVGQDPAVRLMSVAIHKHLVSHSTGNVLMIGNSGTGKTTLLRAVGRFLSGMEGYERFSTIVRMNANVLADLTAKGGQAHVLLDRLAMEAMRTLREGADLDTMREYVSHGIVCIDEVDKIRAEVRNEANVKGIMAQDSLLTLLEDEHVQMSMPYYERGKWQRQNVLLNTKHILFIAAGAFEDLYSQVLDRVVKKDGWDSLRMLVERSDGTLDSRMVFRLGDHVSHEDLFSYGMMPQFMARFGNVIMLKDLGPQDLARIFTDVPDAIWPAAQDYFKRFGIDLQITEDAMHRLVDRAAENSRLGARALWEIFAKVIGEYEFDPRGTGAVEQRNGQDVLELTGEMVEAALASD